MVVASPSTALAVMPTVVPTEAFSLTLFSSALASAGVLKVVSKSSASPMLMVKAEMVDEPSVDEALT